MYREKSVGVVIPAYNEERHIGEVIETIPSYVDSLLVIDDCSEDSTPRIVAQHAEKSADRITLIRHDSRRGVGGAIVTGYRESLNRGYDIVVIMAGDGQMDPSQLPRLLDPIIDENADYSKGNRLLSGKLSDMPKIRIRGNALLTFLTKVASGYYDVMDPQNGYTAISRKALMSIDFERIYPGYGYCNEILIQLNMLNFRVADVVMPPRYRDEKSYIKVGRYTLRLTWLLTKGFFYRIFRKYSRPKIHPVLLFYLSSFVLLPIGVVLGLLVTLDRILLGGYSIGTVLLASLMLILGVQSLCFATFFDAMRSGYRMKMDHSGETRASGGFFSRLRHQYLGINFHPLGLFYLAAIALLVIGIVLGAAILYGRVVTGGFSLGSVTLNLLILVVGAQFFFFAMLFEAERERFLE